MCAALQQRRPAAGFDRLFSSVLQLVPRAQPPTCFWEPWQSLGRSVVGRAIPHVPVSEPSGPRRRPPVAACSCLAVVQCPEFPFRMTPGSAAGPGSPGSRSEVLALLGRDPRSPQVQRHHPDQSLRLPSVYLRVLRGTSPAAVPRGCSGGSRLCSGSAPWLRPGATLSKCSECAARRGGRGEERRGEEKALGAPHEVGEADLFPKCCSARACGVSPCPGGASLWPQALKVAQWRFLVPDTPSAACLPACMLSGKAAAPS